MNWPLYILIAILLYLIYLSIQRSRRVRAARIEAARRQDDLYRWAKEEHDRGEQARKEGKG